MMKNFKYRSAASLREALKALAEPGARLHAGGTDLLGCLRDGVFGAESVVSISGIQELKGAGAAKDGGLRVGALTTLAQLASDPEVRRSFTALAEAAASAASPQLRNQGTVGGNLCQKPRCWYYRGDFHCARKGGSACYAASGENQYHCIFGGDGCYYVHPSDTAPALVALEGRARIVGSGGTRVVPLSEFFVPPAKDLHRETVLEPGEILTEVVVPPLPPGTKSAYRKIRERASWDFALASAAAVLTVEGGVVKRARIALGGVAPVPWRAVDAEKALVGKRLESGAIGEAAKAAVAGADPLEKNGYKVQLVEGLVEETLTRMATA